MLPRISTLVSMIFTLWLINTSSRGWLKNKLLQSFIPNSKNQLDEPIFWSQNWYPHLLIIILPYTHCKNLCALLCISAYPLKSSHFYNVINAPKLFCSNAIKTYKQIIFYSLNVAMTYPLTRCSPAPKTRGQISSFFPPRCTQWLVTYPRYQ